MACESPVPESGWPVDPHVGQVLGGKYRVDARLGAGGFGTVLKATQLHGQQDLGQVVLKVLHADLAQQDSVRRRFVNEARAARQLSSPHAVKVFDLSYDEQGVPFIVMEYLQGESLADLLERVGQLELSRVLAVGRQVAEALAECHAKEIIHRDLKPDNILLLPGHAEDFAKILDFGIARVPSPTGRVTQTLMGTPLYMSPEQIRQQPIDQRVDIFALGVILFESLVGEPPIAADAHTDYIQKNCEVAPARLRDRLPDAPAALDQLVDAMMAKQPDQRPPNMRAVSQVLSDIAATAPAELAPPDRGQRAPSTPPKLTTLSASTGTQELARSVHASQRRPLIYGGVAVLLLALAVFGYWQLGRGGDPAPRPGGSGETQQPSPAPDAAAARPQPRVRRLVTPLPPDAGAERVGMRERPKARPAVRPRARVMARPNAMMRPRPRPMEDPRPRPRPTPEDDPFQRVR